MKKSKIYDYGHILKYVPILNYIILLRFSFISKMGYFDGINLFFKEVVLALVILVIWAPMVLVTTYCDVSNTFVSVLIMASIYITGLVTAIFALIEEKKVRDSGFFWSETDRENPS